MISIKREFSFEAAHRLPDYEGDCRNLHGHSYRLVVEVSGNVSEEGPERGMIVDFKVLKKMVQDEVLSYYDHTFLNDTPDFSNRHPPTAENIVFEIMRRLRQACSMNELVLIGLELWETEKSCAVWRISNEDI